MPNKKGAAAKHTPKSVVHDDTRRAFRMREVADQLGVSEKTIYNWIDAGQLRAVKIGRLVRIPAEAVVELLEGDAS